MLFSFLFFISQLSNYDILEQAEKQGFFYKQVKIYQVKKCDKKQFCFQFNDKKYELKNKNKVKITLKKLDKQTIKLSILPSNEYVAYYLYIQRKNNVEKKKITMRNIVLKGTNNIFAIQIVGEGVYGPETIFLRHFSYNLTKFNKNFYYSLNLLRKKSGLNKLTWNNNLKKYAEKSILRIKNNGLIHFSSSKGGLSQSGIHSPAFGEDLFSAQNLEEAFFMLQKSPSHLFNILSPNFNYIFETHFEKNGLTTGIIIFSY